MKTFELTIATLDKNVFRGVVQSVTIPGSEGEMTILAQHVPVITRTRPGTVRYCTEDGETHSLAVAHEGTLEVSRGSSVLLI